MQRLITYFALATLATACSAKTLDVGSNNNNGLNGGSCPDASAATPLPQWPSPDACVVGSEMTMFVGVWEGYVQGSSIGDEASTFRINILGANSANGLCGTVTYGIHTAAVTIPQATDPTVRPALVPSNGTQPNPSMVPILGLSYTIRDGKVDGQRATFRVDLYEIFKSWCALQTPYATDQACDQYNCTPNWSGTATQEGSSEVCQITDPATQASQSVPCDQWLLCSTRAKISLIFNEIDHLQISSRRGSTIVSVYDLLRRKGNDRHGTMDAPGWFISAGENAHQTVGTRAHAFCFFPSAPTRVV